MDEIMTMPNIEENWNSIDVENKILEKLTSKPF
jgi:hypothetical protein